MHRPDVAAHDRRLARRAFATIIVTLACLALSACQRTADEPPSLLLVTIDTLRADHLSVYGYPWPTSPTLDALAGRGVVFEQAYAPVPETSPSCAALLTGRWPAQLGVRGNAQPLRPGVATLAEILSAAGYRTAAFVSGFPLVRRLSGLHRGFHHYDERMPDPRGPTDNVQRFADKTAAAARAWLEEQPAGPVFVWLHFYDPHGDYSPGAPYDAMFADRPSGPEVPRARIPGYQRAIPSTDAAVYTARYDGEIRKVDDQLATVLDALASRGELERAVVAITADHGESLTEHDYYFDHGNELYGPSIHIPLIMAGAGLPSDGRRVAGPARTVDVLPTLLELLGRPAPDGLAGASLVPRIRGDDVGPWPEALSEARFKTYRQLTQASKVGPKLAVRDERYTAVWKQEDGVLELYDRQADPGETRDLLAGAGGAESLRDTLRRGMAALHAAAEAGAPAAGEPQPRVFSADAVEMIQALAAEPPADTPPTPTEAAP